MKFSRPTFLNLNLNLNTLRLQTPTGGMKPSPGNPKIGLRMTTLHEEQIPITNRKHSLDFDRISDIIEEDKYDDNDDENDRNNDLHDFETPNQSRVFSSGNKVKKAIIPSSRTLDSLVELQAPKTSTPSTSSSGYGSQAVSSTNLTSEDSMSLHSISVDETPDFETRPILNIYDLKPIDKHNVDSDKINDNNEIVQEIDNVPTKFTVTSLPNKSNEYSSKEDKSEYDSPSELTAVVKTKLQPGKVMRRRRTNMKSQHILQLQRASFPLSRPQVSENRNSHQFEQQRNNHSLSQNGDLNSSLDRLEEDGDNSCAFGSRYDLHRIPDTPMPEWVVVGESVLIRPYNSSGVIAYIGDTEFANGQWIGVELDTPTGKNDGSVNGVYYFNCRPKHGIFVRVDKLIQDRRGRAMRAYKAEQTASLGARPNRGELSMTRSRSRAENLNTKGNRSSPKPK